MDAASVASLGDWVQEGTLKAVGVGLVTGIGFGILIEKSNLSETYVVRAQCKLRKHTMIKTFLSAAGTSSVVFGLLKWFYPEIDIAPRPQILLASGIGGALLGVGGFICGSCPPTLLTQLGAGIPEASYAFPGAILGTTAFAYLQPSIYSLLGPPREYPSIPQYFQVPFWYLSIPYSVCIYAQLSVLEQWMPYVTSFDEEDDSALEQIGYSNLRLSQLTWPPRKAGFGLGLLQAPAVLFTNTPLGTSAAFVTLAAHAASLFDVNVWSREYLTRFMFGDKNYWQLALDLGIIFGAYISARASGKRERHLKRKKMTLGAKTWAFAGGFIMLFGARFADGCTSGHGMSGVAQFGVGSFVGVASMIAGGYTAASIASHVPGTKSLHYTRKSQDLG